MKKILFVAVIAAALVAAGPAMAFPPADDPGKNPEFESVTME